MNMKKIATVIAVLAFVTTMAFAQSSGNFSYGTSPQNDVACSIDQNGAMSGTEQCQESCTIDTSGNSTCTAASGTCNGHAVAGIKTSSGAGNIFVIRPSAVIGLLTDVTVSSKQAGSSTGAVSSSALAGVDFKVTVKGPSGDVPVIPSGYITYDSRYIQISTNLFQALATQCSLITGGCFLTFNESTVSAHSFDFLAGGPVNPLTAGQYTVTTTWKTALGGSGISESLTCVGPLNMTVQQNKVFSFNTINPL
ncbi:MAG TPA: hypothetical protein VKI40_11690 [Terriglobales bacterium]|jgi:hypothetical protein|nr:hypothetical protein [Terriglobales bacterium]